jgi:hypothetical protein
MSHNISSNELLQIIGGAETPTPEQLRELICRIDSHAVLAKVFILEGVPHVFRNSPMKYVIFREQVADRFNVGSQDVCIVGSAKLGYSPSPHKYGTPFDDTSDVDVVVISDPLFDRGSRALFADLNQLDPPLHQIRPHLYGSAPRGQAAPQVPLHNWRRFKEAARNFVYQNFNPGLLPNDHPVRIEIFDNISGTAGLFLALEPKVFVSKLRCRVFRTWKAAEEYYANSLREARNFFTNDEEPESDVDDEAEDVGALLETPPNGEALAGPGTPR